MKYEEIFSVRIQNKKLRYALVAYLRDIGFYIGGSEESEGNYNENLSFYPKASTRQCNIIRYNDYLNLKIEDALNFAKEADFVEIGDCKVEYNKQSRTVTYDGRTQSVDSVVEFLNKFFELDTVYNHPFSISGTMTIGCLYGPIEDFRKLWQILKSL